MHQALAIQEVLLNIFGYCSLDSRPYGHKADLATLARTCQTFKDPALDVLWEQLRNLSPIARCLPGVCCKLSNGWSFSRPLSKADWAVLRGYTRRVRSIHLFGHLNDSAVRLVFTRAPSTDPLFPNLQSLSWKWCTRLPEVHTAVPSLTSLHISFYSLLCRGLGTEFLDAIGDRCPNMTTFSVFSPPLELLDAVISRQLRRWKNLQRVHCFEITLSIDTILDFASIPTLKLLSFTLGAEVNHHTAAHGSLFIFPKLDALTIQSASLESITNLFSRIQLPEIKELSVEISQYTPRQDVIAYWVTVQKTCPSGAFTRLEFSSSGNRIDDLDQESRPQLTLGDLLLYKDFGNLHKIAINVAWPVHLTDPDVLDLVSTSPQLQELSINGHWGWEMDNGSGITLSGLVQLLRQCPSLDKVCLAIDARTFTQIPDGLDVSFLPRKGLSLNILDSYVAHEHIEDLRLMFKVLGMALKWNSFQSFR